MKRTFTKQLLGRTAMLLLTLSASLTAMAEPQPIGDSGTTWEITGEGNTRTLIISGTGAMPDFATISDSPWGALSWNEVRQYIKNIVVENGVTSIGKYAFYPCQYVTNVTIGSGVASIGQGAFRLCAQLETINIPGNVKTIANSAFSECTKLSSVTLNEGLETIMSDAFIECSSLTKIHIPQSVTTIGYNPFDECSNLTTITVADGNTHFTSPNNNCIVETSTHKLITGTSTIPEGVGVTEIGSYAFYGRTMETLAVPEGVITIGSHAFRGCANLTTVTLPSTLKVIDMWGFCECTHLSSVKFPTSIETIDMLAFNGCPALQEVKIPCVPHVYSSESFPATTTVKLTPAGHTVDGNKWMTFYNKNVKFKANENTTVYKAKIEDSKVKLTAIADKIVPAGQAVVLKSTGDVEMTLTTEDATGDFEGNDLGASYYNNSNAPANCYTLANGTNGVGFYKYTGAKIGLNKAYLIYEAPPGSRSFFEISTDDETTAVDAATKQETNDEWYTLDGRQMKGQPTKAGVYVKKNKVVVIK